MGTESQCLYFFSVQGWQYSVLVDVEQLGLLCVSSENVLVRWHYNFRTEFDSL